MDIPFYQVDAFTNRALGGNPAAVCPLEAWLDEATMQAIAEENNLSETAYFLPRGEDFEIRWFTPVHEMDLAGHPTLATAHVIMTEIARERNAVTFHTKIGDTLVVTRTNGRLAMDFPARPPSPRLDPAAVATALRAEPTEVLAARDGFAVFTSEAEVRALDPDMPAVAALDCLGVIATAPGDDADFVSRFFAPGQNIPEDPVTGSAHCTLIPYWAERLDKTEMFARQVSERGGEIWCKHNGARVEIAGEAVTLIRGTLSL